MEYNEQRWFPSHYPPFFPISKPLPMIRRFGAMMIGILMASRWADRVMVQGMSAPTKSVIIDHFMTIIFLLC